MTYFIKAPLGSEGIVEMRGKMEIVDAREGATELVYGDATFVQGQALNGWPDVDWQVEKISEKKYIVKGDDSN
jgi:hypothetical protein